MFLRKYLVLMLSFVCLVILIELYSGVDFRIRLRLDGRCIITALFGSVFFLV